MYVTHLSIILYCRFSKFAHYSKPTYVQSILFELELDQLYFWNTLPNFFWKSVRFEIFENQPHSSEFGVRVTSNILSWPAFRLKQKFWHVDTQPLMVQEVSLFRQHWSCWKQMQFCTTFVVRKTLSLAWSLPRTISVINKKDYWGCPSHTTNNNKQLPKILNLIKSILVMAVSNLFNAHPSNNRKICQMEKM